MNITTRPHEFKDTGRGTIIGPCLRCGHPSGFVNDVCEVTYETDPLVIKAFDGMIFMVNPDRPTRLTGVVIDKDSPDLDIITVTIGNIFLTAFAKQHPIAYPTNRIQAQIKSVSTKDIETSVKFIGTVFRP